MTLSSKKPRKIKKNILIGIGALILLSGGIAYAVLLNSEKNNSDKNSKIDYSGPTEEQKKAGEDAKKEGIKNTLPADNPKTNQPAPTPQQLETQITAASVEGSVLYIRNEINGIYQEGSCSLSLTKGTSTVSKTAGIQPLPKSSTCKGFNIPVRELSSGTWNINLRVNVGSQSGITTANVVVQ